MKIKTLNEAVGQKVEWPNVRNYKLDERGWGAVYHYTGLRDISGVSVTFEMFSSGDKMSVRVFFEGGGHHIGGMIFSEGIISNITDVNTIPDAVSGILEELDTDCFKDLHQRVYDLSWGDALSLLKRDSLFADEINRAAISANVAILGYGIRAGKPEITRYFKA